MPKRRFLSRLMRTEQALKRIMGYKFMDHMVRALDALVEDNEIGIPRKAAET